MVPGAIGTLSSDDLVDCATSLLASAREADMPVVARLFKVASGAGNLRARYSWASMLRLGMLQDRELIFFLSVFLDFALFLGD